MHSLLPNTTMRRVLITVVSVCVCGCVCVAQTRGVVSATVELACVDEALSKVR